jgi:small subunit ribosomal protein S24e
VNHRNRDPSEADFRGEKQLFAFAEKVRNVSTAHAQNAQTFLRNCTRLDPMTYMLFGAYHLEVTERGLDCDDWLPITGNIDALDNIQRLKTLVDSCMLRVYEGIGSNIGKPKPPRTTAFASSPSASSVYRIPQRAREAVDEEEEEDRMALVDSKGSTLSDQEIKELDWMTRDIVKILNQYSEERLVNQSRHNSRPATPSTYSSPGASHSRLPAVGPSGRGLLGMQSGYSTPYNRSRPATPSGLRGHYLM